MNKSFFKYMEKNAFIGAVGASAARLMTPIMGGMTALSTVADIKSNKTKMKLEPSAPIAGSNYSHQFKTPGKSIFG